MLRFSAAPFEVAIHEIMYVVVVRLRNVPGDLQELTSAELCWKRVAR